jgi:hypothetical protein
MRSARIDEAGTRSLVESCETSPMRTLRVGMLTRACASGVSAQRGFARRQIGRVPAVFCELESEGDIPNAAFLRARSDPGLLEVDRLVLCRKVL